MKKILTEMKEVCQYVGIILVAYGAAVWLMVREKDISGISHLRHGK